MTADDHRPRRPLLPGVLETADDGWEPWAGSGAQQGRTNRLAIAAFVLGLLGGVLGAVLAVFALRRIRRTGERGRGFAVAGLVLFGVWALVLVLVLTVPPSRPEPESGVRGLRIGDCFRVEDIPSGTRAAPDEVTEVPCTEPHDAELVDRLPGYERYADEAYPGTAALSARAESACRRQQRSYVLDPLSIPAEVRLRWYVPSRVEWGTDPQITCYLAAGGSPLTRPLRQDATVLRPEQLAYLMAVRDFDEARNVLAAQGPTAPPAELRTMVQRTASAHAGMWLALSGGTWPAQAQEPIGKLVAQAQGAAVAWRDAEKAPDRDQMLRLVAQAEQRRDPQTELAVRRALGLSTTQGEQAR
ncbi:DUF4190 domain-containing protein [Micromonospora halophytica]|uniref:Septum formation n=1 Tax=Micromonospora halophytica TaxID=47864 RepID=A0A1C5GJY8_9ACTN|nr:DUF4190 domain-containing protein [Micromonospora halophytica]SCG34108.1 Septum formation [Micromonospora halophytica]